MFARTIIIEQTKKRVMQLVLEKVDQLKQESWQKCFKHVQKYEEKYSEMAELCEDDAIDIPHDDIIDTESENETIAD